MRRMAGGLSEDVRGIITEGRSTAFQEYQFLTKDDLLRLPVARGVQEAATRCIVKAQSLWARGIKASVKSGEPGAAAELASGV